jgi:hypothetical protein
MPGAETHPLGRAGLGPPLLVGGPLLGQVQADVHQGVLGPAGVAQVDADRAVVDLAQPAAPLPLHAHRRRPLLGEGRRVEHQHPVGFAELFTDLAGQFGEQGPVPPGGLAEELLQPLAFLVVQVGDALGVLAPSDVTVI